MSPPPRYERPASLEKAIAIMGRLRECASPLAGGTDIAVRLRRGGISPDVLVDIGRLGLDRIEEAGGGLVVGAMVRIADLGASALVAARAPILLDAAAGFGSPQIRAAATVGGNLANASPVADLAPPLLALGASVTLAGPRGEREAPVEEFLVAPGVAAREPDELVVAIRVPFQRGAGAYERLAYRGSLSIAAASIAVHVETRGGAVTWARVAAGAVAPRAVLCPRTAAALVGARSASAGACEALAAETSPISDPRASREYRAAALGRLLGVALERCLP